MKTKENQLGIIGEPQKGVIYHDEENGIELEYDPNTQIITFFEDEEKYDAFDCSPYKYFREVIREIKNEYGITIDDLGR